MATTTKQINLRIENDLLKTIDRKRGLTGRNAWIVWAIEEAVGEAQDAPPRPSTRSPEPKMESRVTRGPDDADHWMKNAGWGGIGGKPPIQKRSKR